MTTRQSIRATLAYHDIFDYPLTLEEIHRYLIKKASLKSVKLQLEGLVRQKKVGKSKDFLFLKNRSLIVKTRIKHTRFSQDKLKRARFYSKLLTLIPTIKLAAISGALAMQNSQKQDDIDFVIVTSKKTLWTTRFLSNVLLFPFKRSPISPSTVSHQLSLNNKACLNIFIDESNLKIKDQNLYTAHEICQLKPIWDRDKTYSKFIKANRWVFEYLPNWQPDTRYKIQDTRYKNREDFSLPTSHLSPVEALLKKFQLWYMKDRVTTEKVGETQLFFHPQDAQEWVIKEYQKRIRKLKVNY